MKKLFTLIILCSSFTFAQYIKKATFVLTDGKKMDVEDVVYGDKVYEYKLSDNLFSNQLITKDNVSELIFDSIDYSEDIPKIKETLLNDSYPEGQYLTIDDFYKQQVTSTEELIARTDGDEIYNFPNDLVLFKNAKKEIIKAPFAIVYQGDLFFNVKGLDKIESKEMKALYSNSEAINRYVRVKYADKDFYYTEVYQKKTNDGAIIGAMFGIVGSIIASAIDPPKKDVDVFPIILLNQDRKVYQVNDCLNFNKILSDKLNIKLPCRKKEDNILQNVRKHIIKNK